MRFINYHRGGGVSGLYFDETQPPSIGPDEVLVEVKAFGVNRADLLQRNGHYPPPPGASEILGLECSGVVCGTGDNVDEWNVGDPVFGLVDGGAYAEFCAMDAGMIWRKPDILNWAEAAVIPEAFLTAYQALYRILDVAGLNTVMIHAAASGVGTAAIQLLKDLPVKKWGTASGKKIPFCLEMGYDAIINYENESFLESILKWTNHDGVDGIVDFVGGSYFQDNIRALALEGTMVMLGTLGTIRVESLNILPIISRRLTIIGSTLRSREKSYKRKLAAHFDQQFGHQFQLGKIKPCLFLTLAWSEINQAHDIMENNQNMGKIALIVN